MLVCDLTLTELLGEGHFGKIYLTSKKGELKKYATKVIKLPKNNHPKAKKAKRYLNNEIYILKDINHHNIIKFIEKHHDSINAYIVTELCNGGNLNQVLRQYQKKNNKGFPEEIVQYIMNEVIDAVKYLHNKKIIHRKIYLNNIMINYEDEDDMKNNNII